MIIFTFFTLIMQSTCQLCQKDLDEKFQLHNPKTYLRVTYQLAQYEQITLTNKTMIEIISIKKEIITFSYFNNYFEIFSNNLLISNLHLAPGQYFAHEIVCTSKDKPCNFQTQIYQLKEMQFKICLDQDFVQYSYQEFVQQWYLYEYLLQNLDNKFFHISLWIKEIVPGNLPIQIYFSSPQGCIFIFNFKTNKIICCNVIFQKEIVIQEIMILNTWFYFEFNQYLDQQEFINYFILGQFNIWPTKSYRTKINYSFENQLRLNYPNSIISNFVIKESILQKTVPKICMPDCKQCKSYGECLECNNNLKLDYGMCQCERWDLITDQDGNCLYPANFLQLKEFPEESKCPFGFYFSDVPEINCLQSLSQEQTNFNIQYKNEFSKKFQQEISKEIKKYRCPKNCLSCIIVDKRIICQLCKQGLQDNKGLCQLCNIQHCQYCLTNRRQICLLCFEFYTLNSYQQCIRSKEYQFHKLMSQLVKQIQKGDYNCHIQDQNGCKLCSQGYSMQNRLCEKYQKLNLIYDQFSTFAKYPLLSFEVRNNKIYFRNIDLLNLQKVYFESSIKSKILIDQHNNFTPSYYSKNINQYTFCKIFNNCDNYLVPLGTHKYIEISNIKIVSSINMDYILVFLTNNETRFLIENMTLIQQNQKNINAIVINSQQNLQVVLSNIKLAKNCLNSLGTSNQTYINIVAKQVYLHNFQICKLDQSALKINSNEATFSNFMIAKVKSEIDIITIDVSRILICNIVILQSQSLMSILNINQQQLEQLHFRNLQFRQNIIENGHLIVLVNKLANYSMDQLRQIKPVLYGLQSIQNTCKICFKFIYNLYFNQSIRLKESFEINNIGNLIFELQNISAQISNGVFQHNSTQFEYFYISANKLVVFNGSSIILNGILTESSNQNYISYKKSIVSINQQQDDTLKYNQLLFPTELKLSINKLSQELNLQPTKISQNFQQYQLQNFIYFPSGTKLNGYKILKIDKRQYLQYIDQLFIYGFNENNNLKLRINKCDLTTNNNNISITPNNINSTLLLSDVVFIGNPYLIGNFTLKVSCQYHEMQLQLLIDSKLFKCQLGEIFYQNKCKQCNIGDNLYSVKKHSQMCKLVDDQIEEVLIGLIKLKPGYWRPYYSNDQIEYCQLNNCLGGWDVDYKSCVQGCIGPLCTECDYNNIRGNGYYSKYRQQCFECQQEVNYIYNVLYILFIQLLTLTITTRSQYLICQRYQVLICQNKYYQLLNKLSIDQISVFIKQIQNYFFYVQFVNIIFDIDLNLGIIVNTVSNPIQILNPQYDCIISQFSLNQQITKIFLQIITPISILIIFYSIIIIIYRFIKFKHFYVFIYTPLLQFFIIYQIIIFQSAISFLTYIQISGIKWIYGAKHQQYYESYNINLFITSSVIIFIFAIFIPFNFVLLLYKKQDILQNKVIMMKIGYFYQEYKNNRYYWEFMKMTIKIIFITISFGFINNYNKRVPISAFYFVCMLQLLITLKPHYLQNLNQYDQQFHILFVIDLLIIGLIQHVYQRDVKNILIMIMYMVNILFFLRTYYNNPQIIDKIRQNVMKYKGQTLMETKKLISHKYLLMKRYAKAQTNQNNQSYDNEPKYYQNQANSPILVSSNIVSNKSHLEIELASFKQQ